MNTIDILKPLGCYALGLITGFGSIKLADSLERREGGNCGCAIAIGAFGMAPLGLLGGTEGVAWTAGHYSALGITAGITYLKGREKE